MLNIVILGGNGFIGSSLTQIFRNSMYVVNSLTRLEILNSDNFLTLLIKSDIVINCIGSANVHFSYSNTEEDFNSNVGILQFCLNLMKNNQLNHIRFINLSSAAVYGNPIKLPISETDQTNPVSPYGFHKRISEYLMKEYSLCFGLKTVSVRVFSAYGIGQRKLLLWDLHQKIVANKGSINIFGTGNETRDFIHILDIYAQILLVIDNADFNGEVINVANGIEIRIADVVGLFKKYYPRDFHYEFSGEKRLGDPLNWCANIDILKNWGYIPMVNFENSIKEYIDWVVNE